MKEQITIPYIVFESTMARAERQQKRLVIALIVAVVIVETVMQEVRDVILWVDTAEIAIVMVMSMVAIQEKKKWTISKWNYRGFWKKLKMKKSVK